MPHRLFVRAFDYPVGYQGNVHQHRLRQIVYPARGIVTVDTDDQHVTVGPYRAYAIEPWTRHRVSAIGNASLRSVFLDPEAGEDSAIGPPDGSDRRGVFGVSPLLHELIREAGNHYGDLAPGSVPAQILALIESLLFTARASTGYVELPRVSHPRLARAFRNLFTTDEFPALRAADCAAEVALSPRQFRRLFRQHTGISFKDWRAIARVRKAAEKIARGESLTDVAHDLSMSSASALAQVFKRHTGLTTGEFARLNRPTRSSRASMP